MLNFKLDNITKFIHVLNNGTNTLYEILEVGERKVIGIDYSGMNKNIKTPSKKCVPPKKKTEYLRKDHMSQHCA